MSDIDIYKKTLEGLSECAPGDLDFEHRHVVQKIQSFIRHLETQEMFGFNFRYTGNPSWINISDYQTIGHFGEKYSRTVSWSDDGEQPEDEWLYSIQFPTGAYIFGDSYPTETFNAFFVELKTYEPKYSDSHNHCLYFDCDKAKHIHKEFANIKKKYAGMVKEELDKKRVVELRKELGKLTAVEA